MALVLILCTEDDLRQRAKESIATCQRGVNVKQQECFLIFDADAVVHPGTVVVHTHHAPLAKRAVVRFWRLAAPTVHTVLLVLLQDPVRISLGSKAFWFYVELGLNVLNLNGLRLILRPLA